MDPSRTRTRIIKLSGLPEVLGNTGSHGSRVVDVTTKRVSRVTQHSPLSPTRPIPQHRITKPARTSPKLLHQLNQHPHLQPQPQLQPQPPQQAQSPAKLTRPSPPPPTPPPAEYHLFKSLQHLEIITKRIESMFKMLREQQLQPPQIQPQPLQPSPQPQQQFKQPLTSPNYTSPNCQHQHQHHHQQHQPPPSLQQQRHQPSSHHYSSREPTPTNQRHHQSHHHHHSQPTPSQHYRQRQHTPVHDITEALADVSISSREYLSRHNLLELEGNR